MIASCIGGILMVLGMFAIIAQPVLGLVMIGGGYWLFQQSTASQRHEAQSLFFGFCLLCGAIVAVVGLAGFIL